MENLRQIIREEVYRVMQEVGQEDPILLSKDMVKSNEDQAKELRDELKYREADARVSNLPRDERDARVAMVKVVKDRLASAEAELEMAKQSQINAVQFSQMQQADSSNQVTTQTQVQTQV